MDVVAPTVYVSPPGAGSWGSRVCLQSAILRLLEVLIDGGDDGGGLRVTVRYPHDFWAPWWFSVWG